MTVANREPLFILRSGALHRMVLQYHPQIGQLYVSNIRARIPSELGGYYVTTNSQGFRSNHEFVQQKSGRPRVLFFGDSFTAGFGVSNEQRFTDLIAKMLDVEVYNYGLTGSGTDQQLLIFEQFAQQVEADLIVLCVLVENIERIVRTHHRTIDRYSGNYVYVPKPYFTKEDGRLQLHHYPVPMERPESLDQEGVPAAGSPQVRQRAIQAMRQLYYHPWLGAIRGERAPGILQNDMLLRFLKVAQYQPYPAYVDEKSAGWQLMSAIIQRFVEGASSTPVLIIPLPDSYFYRATPLKPVYQQRFESLARPEQGVHVADITTPINKLPVEERARLPFQHDFHFSPYGNKVVADIIAAEITARNLLPRPSQTPVTVSSNGERAQSGPKAGLEAGLEAQDNYILGISCFYHNSAAALLKNGEIIAAAEEERFSRIKHDRNFPHRAINYCLEEAGIQQDDLAAVVYYDNAYLTFERLMHTQLAVGEKGEEAWLRVLPSWIQHKLSIPSLIGRYMNYSGPVLHDVHHRSHAASAFYPSPFKRAAILTIDGVGEWATASISVGRDSEITMLKEMHFPHSLGLLYSAFTQFVGFQVNNGEYKMMGLAPYGEPVYVDLIYEHLVKVNDDGSIELNMDYFAFLSEPRMTTEKFDELFGGPPRHPSEPVTQRDMDISRSIQEVTEEIVMRMARHAHELTGEEYLCLAGGVALNCVANGRLLREGPFKDLWIQPAAGDAGCALGAALDTWHTYFGKPRTLSESGRSVQGGSFWGPSYTDTEIKAFLDTYGYPAQKMDENHRAHTVAGLIKEGKVVGHFSGRMEYGPRALGARSILGDARNQEMQTTINLKIKYRESFRPFAPAVLEECIGEYFELDRETPYMLLVAPVVESRRLPYKRSPEMTLYEIVRQPRSDVPAITHVDYSARIQSVRREDHPEYYDAINAFRTQTGYGVIVNTSFNVRGEPIICSPYDAYRCFMRTEMDVLVMGNFLLFKEEQPPYPIEKGHIEHYDPDELLDPADDPGLEPLRRLFREMFLPLSGRYQASTERRVEQSTAGVPGRWHSCSPQTAVQIFEIPETLANRDETAADLAAAIVRYWQPGFVRNSLEPVISRLLEIGGELSAVSEEEELVEEVSEFVYVMY